MIPRRCKTALIFVALIASYSWEATAADMVTGVVHNRTRGELAAGDEVIRLRVNPGAPNPAHLNQGTQEEGRTRTDSQGSFIFTVRYPGATHLVRVVHQGVNYEHQVVVGRDNSIDVFDAAAQVEGITGTIEIIRVGTNGKLLHVSDMVEIRNDSSPPLTKSGDRTFEVYLPALAKIDSVLAASSSAGSGREAAAVTISAAPIPGELGHYAVNFPLQPGATKFAFNYDLPYRAHATFRPRSMYPLQQLAVMIPPSMRFTAQSTDFVVLNTGNDRYQVEAASMLKPGAGPPFEISGVGALPALKAQDPSPPKAPVATESLPAATASASGTAQRANALKTTSSGTPVQFSPVHSHLPWWVPGTCAVMLGGCGLLLWRRQRLSNNERTKAIQKSESRGKMTAPAVEAFKAELLGLEIDRSRGTVSGEEYVAAKAALEETVERVMARSETG
jgi:hypothetical protein